LQLAQCCCLGYRFRTKAIHSGNPFLRDALETITFRLFVFSIVDRWSGNPKAVSERLAAVQEHLAILEGLRSRNKKIARKAFIKQSIDYGTHNMG